MKKVLFATTALIATAGVVHADVKLGGYGRFGLKYVDNGVTTSTDITSRFRLQIDATAESDNGLEVGARVRIQQNAGGSGEGINGARFFARTNGFEVGVGNIFGALEYMPGQYPIDLGLTGLGYEYTAYAGLADFYKSGGCGTCASNGVEVMYSAGDLSVHVSASDDNDRVAGYVSYAVSGWTFALGAQDSSSPADTEWTASVGGTVGSANVGLAYADNGDSGNVLVLSGSMDVGADTNVEAYYADRSDAGLLDGDSFGIDFNHDLGGGVSLRGGVVSMFNDDTVADLGVRFNF